MAFYKGDIPRLDVTILKKQHKKESIKISELIISTQSAKAKMNVDIDIKQLTEYLLQLINKNNTDFPVVGLHYKSIRYGTLCRKKSNKKKKEMPNNVAISIRSPINKERNVYVRVFNKRSISIVGCKVIEDGLTVLHILELLIKNKKSLFSSLEERINFKITDFEITMINSNFSLGFEIDRSKLFHYFYNEHSTLFSSYDPPRYAAVKLAFYYNELNTKQLGVCSCPEQKYTLNKGSSGKGSGDGIYM